jgi:hypothetical protein
LPADPRRGFAGKREFPPERDARRIVRTDSRIIVLRDEARSSSSQKGMKVFAARLAV